MPYSFESRVRYSEIDEKGFLSLGALVDYFQDCSTFQSEDAGIGIYKLKELHQAWLLSSWQIIIHHLPKLCDYVKVSTIPYAFKSFLGYRNFLLEDDKGVAAIANSVWVLFDMDKGKPVRVSEEMAERYHPEEKLEMPYASRKIKLPEDSDRTGEYQEAFFITRHHLDTNHHVNNGQYIRMAMEYLPAGWQIGQVRAEYRMQARLGDEIHPHCYTGGEGEGNRNFLVVLENPEKKPFAAVEFLREDGKTCCELEKNRI